MTNALFSEHLKRSLLEPCVAEWALHRLECLAAWNAGQAREAAAFLFDPPMLRAFLDAADPGILADLFRTVPHEYFKPVLETLLERWPAWQDAQASEAALVLATLAPREALPLFRAHVESDGAQEDFNKLAGVAAALECLTEGGVREVAALAVAALRQPHYEIIRAALLYAAFKIAWKHGLDGTATMVLEGLGLPASTRFDDDAERFLKGAYDAVTDGSPLFSQIRALGTGETEQTLTSLAPLFAQGAPLDELDRLAGQAQAIPLSALKPLILELPEEPGSAALARTLLGEWEGDAEPEEPFAMEFLLGLVAAAWRKHEGVYAELNLRACVDLACVDVSPLPKYSALFERLATFPNEACIDALRDAWESAKQEDTYAAWNLMVVMSDLDGEAFAPDLIRCIEDEDEDQLADHAVNLLSKLGPKPSEILLSKWDNMDEYARLHTCCLLDYAGTEAWVQPLVKAYPTMRNEWLETWCEAAQAIPHEAFVEVLEPELKREHPMIDRTFTILCAVLGLEHPQLAAVRKRVLKRKTKTSQRLDDMLAAPESLIVDMKCSACGDQNRYTVRHVIISPEKPEDPPYIADELTCHSCGESETLSPTAMGRLAITAELMRLTASGKPVKDDGGPLEFVSAQLFDGRIMSLGASIDLYRGLVAKNPRNVETLLGLANCYQSVEKLKEASKWFQKCLDVEPACIEAAYVLAVIQADTGNTHGAFKTLARTLKLRKHWRFYRTHEDRRHELIGAFFKLYGDMSEEEGHAIAAPDFGSAQPTPFSSVPPVSIPRNAPCPCGSGKKHKKCCGRLNV